MGFSVEVQITPYLEFTGEKTPADIEVDIFYPSIQAYKPEVQIWPYNLETNYRIVLDENTMAVDLNTIDFEGVGFELNWIYQRHKQFLDRCYDELGKCQLKYGVVYICL